MSGPGDMKKCELVCVLSRRKKNKGSTLNSAERECKATDDERTYFVEFLSQFICIVGLVERTAIYVLRD